MTRPLVSALWGKLRLSQPSGSCPWSALWSAPCRSRIGNLQPSSYVLTDILQFMILTDLLRENLIWPRTVTTHQCGRCIGVFGHLSHSPAVISLDSLLSSLLDTGGCDSSGLLGMEVAKSSAEDLGAVQATINGLVSNAEFHGYNKKGSHYSEITSPLTLRDTISLQKTRNSRKTMLSFTK